MKSCKKSILCLLTSAFILLAGCGDGNAIQAVTDQLGFAQSGPPDELIISVAVPLDYANENTNFLHGVEMAQQDISEMSLPIPLQIQVDDDKGDFFEAVTLAQQYIENPEVIGVVGHWYSDICLSLVDIYNRGEKVLMVPTVSISNLTGGEPSYIFQNIPNDRLIAMQMCENISNSGFERMVIYYEDSTYGFTMAGEVEKFAQQYGVTVVDRRSSSTDSELVQAQEKWKSLQYDVIVLINNAAEGAEFVNDIRAMGSDVPIVCSDGMDSSSVQNNLDEDSGEIYVASIIDMSSPPHGVENFVNRYVTQYGAQPDIWAVQGYESVMLVAQAVEDGVYTSHALQEYLATTPNMDSLYGGATFENGALADRPTYLKIVSSQRDEYLSEPIIEKATDEQIIT